MIEKIESIFGEGTGLYVLIAAAVIVVVIILLIIVLCAKASKKKKAAKKAASAVTTQETPVAEEPVEEVKAVEEPVTETPTEEPKEEEKPVEETPAEEVPAEEEVKEEVPTEEPVEEVKAVEEPVTEAPAEEPVKEEPKEEVKAEEPKAEEAKPAAKKPAAKKAPAKKSAPKKVTKTEEAKPAEEPVKEEPKEETKPVEEPAKEEAPADKKGVQGKYILVQEGTNWRYKLKASNGEVIIVSEPYKTEKAVRTGIETLKKNLDLSSVDVIEDKHGLFSFRIMTKQGRCLATSANYKAKARAISASESYKRWATTDIILVDEDAKKDTQEVEKIEFEVEEENTGTFIIKPEGDGFVYQLIAANGRVIATSLIYRSKDSCMEACENFRACVYKGDFFVTKDKNQKFQFKLYNKQNRLVLAGEVYDDKQRAISVIEAIKRLAKLAKVVDNTTTESQQ